MPSRAPPQVSVRRRGMKPKGGSCPARPVLLQRGRRFQIIDKRCAMGSEASRRALGCVCGLLERQCGLNLAQSARVRPFRAAPGTLVALCRLQIGMQWACDARAALWTPAEIAHPHQSQGCLADVCAECGRQPAPVRQWIRQWIRVNNAKCSSTMCRTPAEAPCARSCPWAPGGTVPGLLKCGNCSGRQPPRLPNSYHIRLNCSRGGRRL